MTTITTTDLAQAVEDAAAHLYVWALKDIPQDLRDALDAARSKETSVPGKRVLETIHRNVNIADAENNLVCQDTGIAVYYCRVGEHFPLHPARIYAALKEGTKRATVEHPLRSNTVHTLTREQPEGWTGFRRRIDRVMLAEVAWPASEQPRVFVCGPTPLVESVAATLVGLGHLPSLVKTERFGPTGSTS